MSKERARSAQPQTTPSHATQQTTRRGRSRSPAHDLPLEVWLQIISMIPPCEIRKLLGVSRVLFEYVMDNIYREVMLVPSDHSGPNLKTLSQLSQASIACRIEFLYIQPQFVPSPLVHINKAVKGAQNAIVHCKGVRELYLHLHDRPTAPSFPTFLKRMWSTIGPRLKRLTINTTWAKLPVLLEYIPSNSIMRLEELTIRLVTTSSALPRHRKMIYRLIMKLIISHRDTLQVLDISSFEHVDLSHFLSKLGYFPHLRKLYVFFTLSSQTLSKPVALNHFLDAHQKTLEQFCM